MEKEIDSIICKENRWINSNNMYTEGEQTEERWRRLYFFRSITCYLNGWHYKNDCCHSAEMDLKLKIWSISTSLWFTCRNQSISHLQSITILEILALLVKKYNRTIEVDNFFGTRFYLFHVVHFFIVPICISLSWSFPPWMTSSHQD